MLQASDPLTESTRLYLSPFAPELLSAYLTPQFQAYATDVSYHRLETFPDRSYGYITLPLMEAAKVKSKLKGAILKGSKVRVEDARPRKRKLDTLETDANAEDFAASRASKDERKKRRLESKKAQDEIIPGVELEGGRSIKRGWTEPREKQSKQDRKAEKKKNKDDRELRQREKSKYTQEPEMLFRAKMPPNKIAKDSPSKSERQNKKKSKHNSAQATVVHEFEKTQKHASFLKSSPKQSLPSQEFVEGKGWVDQNGSVIEVATTSSREARALKRKKLANSETSQSKGVSINESQLKANKIATPPSNSSDSSDSSSLPSDSESSESEGASSIQSEAEVDKLLAKNGTSNDQTPHPLEQLFKRNPPGSDKRPSPITTSFSFFGQSAEGDSADENDLSVMTTDDVPHTPFAQHVDARNVSRSGAPTPDTAAVHRRFSFTRGAVDDDLDMQDLSSDKPEGPDAANGRLHDILSPVDEVYDDEEPAAIARGKSANGEGQEESAFAKWFWENRGDNNRKWKARRKEAMKEKRHRETRRLGRRII